MLSVTNLTVEYSGIRALSRAAFEVDEGEIVAFIGSNGAGKSTLLNCISGIVEPIEGSIRFRDSEIRGIRAARISRRGLLQVPEGRQIFNELTVGENLALGLSSLGGRAPVFDLPRVHALFPVLAERRQQLAGSLSGGEQQMLAIGRALMGSPQLLLLDEPSLGLAPIVTDQVFQALKKLNDDGLTIVVVEQNAVRALQISRRAFVLEQGALVRAGDSAEMLNDSNIIDHYLGKADKPAGPPRGSGRTHSQID